MIRLATLFSCAFAFARCAAPAKPAERVKAEDLVFPAWMGGELGGRAAAPMLRRVWRRNLANLKSLVEGQSSSNQK